MVTQVALPQLLTRAKEENEQTIVRLVQQLRSPLGIIPFIGAGMSAPLKFPQWAAFLNRYSGHLNQADRKRVDEACSENKLDLAAGLIERAVGKEQFQAAIEESFGDARLARADLRAPRLALLTLLVSGPVITTNLDRVLEKTFVAADCPFDATILGDNADEVVTALQQNAKILWKIHGDWRDRRTRVFTKEEYRTQYGRLTDLLWMALTNRPGLFLGCSLDKDWTLKVLSEIQKRHRGVTQYAIVGAPLTTANFEARADYLHKLGISPIWYPWGQYDKVEELLFELVNRASSTSLTDDTMLASPRLPDPRRLATARATLKAEIAVLKKAQPASRKRAAAQEILPYTKLVYEISQGELAFFLGAGATLNRLPLGQAFYRYLATKFSDNRRLTLERSRIAQLFEDRYERPALLSQIDQVLSVGPFAPSAVHWFLATLPGRLRAKKYSSAALLLLTTNYDDFLERALDAAGEPYHLFLYRPAKRGRGVFIYRSPDGRACEVDRPTHFRRFHPGSTIVVKLHGGRQPVDLPGPVNFAFTHRDFVDLAGRIPGIVPSTLLERLDRSTLLFLGHGLGLGDDSVESLIRELNSRRPRRRTLAVQLKPDSTLKSYWQELGVQIFDLYIEQVILELNRLVERLPGP